ncbi:MAG: tyrosine-type recombinase/integrase, partial [Acidobacteriota bacterium]
DVREMLRKRLEKVGPSTARKNVISIGTLFRWAVMEGIIESNPADSVRVKRPPEPASDSRAMTDDEYTRLLAVCPNWLAALVRWACSTGMDKGMCQRLRWTDLDLERAGTRIVAGVFKLIRGKTGKAIRQVLNEDAIAALNEARRASHTSGLLFLDERSHPIEEKALDLALGKALKASEVRGVTFRTFRHTFATRALRAGVHPRVVGQMMGHATAFITERYMHVADEMLSDAARAMSGRPVARQERMVESLGGRGEVGQQTGQRADRAMDHAPDFEPQPTLPKSFRRGAGVVQQESLPSTLAPPTLPL